VGGGGGGGGGGERGSTENSTALNFPGVFHSSL